MAGFFQTIDPVLVFCFRLHDGLSDFLARHLFRAKWFLLAIAHLSLFGFLFPEWRKDFGEMAANVLIVILFLSPLSKIFRARLLLQMMGLRRELGILMAYLATVHGLGYMLDPDWLQVFIAPYRETGFSALQPGLLFGIAAYTLTLPLLFTSNNLATRFLGGKNWKRLHRLVYGLFVAAIFHRLLIRSGSGYDMIALAQAALLISSYAFVKLLAWRNFLPPLRAAIALVSERYEEYGFSNKQTQS